jgi:primosomal protein N'
MITTSNESDIPTSSTVIAEALGIVTAAAAAALKEPNNAAHVESEMKEKLAEIMWEISFVSLSHRNNWPCYRPYENEFLPWEYEVPLSLQKDTKAVLKHLQSNEDNSRHTHSWILLHWVPGTGKSDFMWYLAGQLKKKALFYILDTASIIASNSPAMELQKTFLKLESEAQKSGKYVVLLIDELDVFMRQHSTMEHEVIREEMHRQSGSHTSAKETTKSTIDQVWSQLFSQLKTSMSGSGSQSRVFVVATTNLSEVPDALKRDGRFLCKKNWTCVFRSFSIFSEWKRD